MSESIVILSFYQFSEVALTQKLLDGLSHLSFALDGQVKCRPKKQAIIKVSHRVVAEGTVCVCVGGGGGGRGAKAVRHDRNFCNFFNFNNFTVSNKA